MRPPGSPRPTTPPARPQHRPGAWKPIRRLDVFYQDDGEPTRVGGLALDDRNKVVDMWREIGLTCFQVAPGGFERKE